ncbi:MAG: hypothetical protein LBM98_12550, partial [Oscillospiraceae bacterium]|nr:hypothetical protein [Oscillospiraceae bacterium]
GDSSTSNAPTPTEKESPTVAPTSKEVTVDERVLFEQSGIKLIVTGLKDSMFGPELTVLIENEGSESVTVQARDVSVNGYMMSSVMFSADVVAGKKNNDTITFMSSELKESGIETLGTIEVSFHVFNSDSWDTVFDTDTITIETSAAGSVEQVASETKRVAFEQNGIKISFVDFDSEAFFGTDIKFYIENNSDIPITVQSRGTSINGFMIDGSMSCDVLPGKMANTTLSFFSSSLEENGITDIESVELKFHILNKDSWDTIIDTDVITLEGSE